MFPSISLNNSEKLAVSSALPSTSQVHHGAICRLYKTNSNNEWEKRLFGAVLILTATDTSSHFIELVDLKTRQICFSQQLYNNFNYNKSTNYFHTFETEDGIIGLSFANEPEAERFYQRVQHCAHPRRVPARPARPFPPPNVTTPTVEPTIPTTMPPQLPIQPAMARPKVSEPIAPRAASPIIRSNSSETRIPIPQARASMPVISFTKEDISSMPETKKEEEKPKLSHRRSFIRDISQSFKDLVGHKHKEKEIVISGPTDFKHVSRIGFNPEHGTFEISNIPPEWRQFFAGVGIKKSDLKNKETATMVMNIIENHNASAPPPIPPRPTPKTESAAPSIPPRRSTIAESTPPVIPPRPTTTMQPTNNNPPPIPPRRATVTERPGNTPPPIPPRRSTISESTAPSIPQTNLPPAIPARPRMAPPPIPGEDSVPLRSRPEALVEEEEQTVKSPAESPSARSRPLRGADFESQLNSAKLKHVEQNSSFKTTGGDLASTLMRAMEERRVAIREDALDFDDDDDDWDL